MKRHHNGTRRAGSKSRQAHDKAVRKGLGNGHHSSDAPVKIFASARLKPGTKTRLGIVQKARLCS
ncbi:MAG: hypothetical protein HZA80_03510 [Candidatus Taylorbacteria bacterium]|nr:hypothetical protein [Candidatus Taylorbacteria bacterium]